jgi:hypothetical protein
MTTNPPPACATDPLVYVDSIASGPDGVEHDYFSTHCRHATVEADPIVAEAGHRECGQDFLRRNAIAGEPVQGLVSVVRRPSQCKVCGTPCICPCHPSSHPSSHP